VKKQQRDGSDARNAALEKIEGIMNKMQDRKAEVELGNMNFMFKFK
jgi:hypothetical protein